MGKEGCIDRVEYAAETMIEDAVVNRCRIPSSVMVITSFIRHAIDQSSVRYSTMIIQAILPNI